MSTPDLDSGLVPFADRVRSLQLTRVALVAGCVGTAALDLLALPTQTVGVLSLVYLALTALSLRAPRLRSRRWAIALSGAALLLDGGYLAVATYATIGFASPVPAVLVLHCVAVTLLASFRTGLKVALWHTLLAVAASELAAADVLHLPGTSWQPVLLLVGMLWFATLTTATFAAVNEREIRRRNYDLLALSRLSYTLEAALRPADVGAALIDAVCDDQGVQRAVLLGAVGEGLERIAGRGDEPVPEGPDAVRDEMIARAVAEHRTLRVPRLDPTRDPWLAGALPDAHNVLLVPVYAEGSVAAVLAAEHGSTGGSRVALRVQAILERYASHAALALTNARLLVRMRRLADTDGLTGVANRRTFDATLLEELVVATAQHTPISLVLVDLDHFKRLNDTLGHQVGDAVLREVGAALSGACRPTDLVARYGGEEFAVILPGVADDVALALAERLRAAVGLVTAAGPAGTVTASIGLAVCAHGVTSATELVAVADRALYRSKADGRDRVTARSVLRAGQVPSQAAGTTSITPEYIPIAHE